MLEYTSKIVFSKSVEEVWAHHLEEMARFGFDQLFYGLTLEPLSPDLGGRANFLILSNLPSSYVDRFVGTGMYGKAPIVNWCMHNTGPISWSWIKENMENLDDEALKVLEFNRSMGVSAGISISFPTMSAGKVAAIGLSVSSGMSQNDVDAHWAEVGHEVELRNHLVNLKINALPLRNLSQPLTSRQVEVLEMVGRGRTNQEIAQALEVSAATVEKHLRLARERLGVESSAQAVLKAAMQNQIFLIEDRT